MLNLGHWRSHSHIKTSLLLFISIKVQDYQHSLGRLEISRGRTPALNFISRIFAHMSFLEVSDARFLDIVNNAGKTWNIKLLKCGNRATAKKRAPPPSVSSRGSNIRSQFHVATSNWDKMLPKRESTTEPAQMKNATILSNSPSKTASDL